MKTSFFESCNLNYWVGILRSIQINHPTMTPSILHISYVRNNYLCLFKERMKIHLSEIILLEADVNYTCLHLRSGKKIMVAKTLKSFTEILLGYNFYRVHRAFLINTQHLRAYNADLREIVLTNNHKIIASRRRKICLELQINIRA
jgi:DNA-binding LytR/AlgR family response regulator